jgi:hypothetical protein
VITPITGWPYYLNRFVFALLQFSVSKRLGNVGFLGKLIPNAITDYVFSKLNGLLTLSLIHCTHWTVIKKSPHLDASQPKENLKYNYMLLFSNFNGSWTQYIDSFHMSIPEGLDRFWFKNVKYPNSVPLRAFHDDIPIIKFALIIITMLIQLPPLMT